MATPKPKPSPKPKVMAKPTPKVKYTPKPKATPVPKFTAPTVAQYRQSAAYKTDSMTYKEYVDASYDVYKYTLKRGK
jgi:outer membrane biosynthesis protein TonB